MATAQWECKLSLIICQVYTTSLLLCQSNQSMEFLLQDYDKKREYILFSRRKIHEFIFMKFRDLQQCLVSSRDQIIRNQQSSSSSDASWNQGTTTSNIFCKVEYSGVHLFLLYLLEETLDRNVLFQSVFNFPFHRNCTRILKFH